MANGKCVALPSGKRRVSLRGERMSSPFRKGGARGIWVLRYRPDLRSKQRCLRKNLTDAERVLWSRLRRDQVLGVRFYRGRPVGNYIVDFYSARASLVVEVDGSQHAHPKDAVKERRRDAYLEALGLRVLRFNDLQVLREPDGVVQVIHRAVADRLGEGVESP